MHFIIIKILIVSGLLDNLRHVIYLPWAALSKETIFLA